MGCCISVVELHAIQIGIPPTKSSVSAPHLAHLGTAKLLPWQRCYVNPGVAVGLTSATIRLHFRADRAVKLIWWLLGNRASVSLIGLSVLSPILSARGIDDNRMVVRLSGEGMPAIFGYAGLFNRCSYQCGSGTLRDGHTRRSGPWSFSLSWVIDRRSDYGRGIDDFLPRSPNAATSIILKARVLSASELPHKIAVLRRDLSVQRAGPLPY